MPETSPEPISVVIPHYNDVLRLERCLEALMPQVDGDAQVIVADNGSDQDLEPIRARWPEVRVVNQPERGAGPARNAGAMTAEARWLAFLDADCIPAPDWLATARRIADETVIFGGAVTLFDETQRPRSGAEAFETVFAFQVESYLKKGFLPSCQLVLSRMSFDRVGGFRVGVSEDVDWSRRATAAGFCLALELDLEVSHPSRQDWPTLRRKWRRLTSEGFLLEGQGAWRRLRWAVKAVLMPASILVSAPKVLRHRELTALEKHRALVTLICVRIMRMIWMLGQAVSGRR